MNVIDIPAKAWLVTDSTGYESLHRDRSRAEQQFSHRPGCRLDDLLTRSSVLAALWEPEPDGGGET